MVNNAVFTNDATKIIYMKTHMTGSAKDWAQSKTDGYATSGVWPTFDEFLVDFEAAYKPPNEAAQAALELDSIHVSRMKPKDYQTLCARFRTLLSIVGTDETNDTYLPHFKKALNDDMLRDVIRMQLKPPSTLKGWMEAVLDFEH